MEIAIAEGEPEEGGVAHVDVADLKAEAERLRAEGVNVGTVFELHGHVRLLDVYDPDGNRIQLAQDLVGSLAVIRPGSRHDARFLRDMLHHAYYWRERAPQDPGEGSVQRYVMTWGRPGDAAVIAYADAGNVGAAWYRLFKEREPGYGFVDERTPELTSPSSPPAAARATARSCSTRSSRRRSATASNRSRSASSRTTRRSGSTNVTASTRSAKAVAAGRCWRG